MQGLSTELLDTIKSLRQEWPNLFIIETIDGYIIFRPTTKGEFSEFSGLFQSLGDPVEDIIFKNCVVYPELSEEDIGELHAGTVTTVANGIIAVSGFGDEEMFLGMLEKSREEMSLVDNQILAVLLKAFPYLTIEDINNLDIQKYTYMLALAETMLGTTLTIQKQDSNTNITEKGINFEEENKQMFGKSVFSGDDFM